MDLKEELKGQSAPKTDSSDTIQIPKTSDDYVPKNPPLSYCKSDPPNKTISHNGFLIAFRHQEVQL